MFRVAADEPHRDHASRPCLEADGRVCADVGRGSRGRVQDGIFQVAGWDGLRCGRGWLVVGVI